MIGGHASPGQRDGWLGVVGTMTRILVVLGLLVLASCAAETGPPGQPSPDSTLNPVSGTSSKGGK